MSGKKLLIVESPAKIKTISKFLGKDFRIVSTFGHIKDLPPKSIGITIDEKTGKMTMDYKVIAGKEKVIKDIISTAKGCDEAYLASDPDREGEIISWHIGQDIEKIIDKSNIYRITFNEITKEAVNKAITNKDIINIKMVNAQQARRALDRWVGYEVSPILWRKIKKGLSAGRVQSAALLLICLREEDIVNFKPEESWSIHGLFANAKAQIEAELVKIGTKKCALKNKAEADKVLVDVKKQNYSVQDIKTKKRIKNPLPPFMTSTIQQASFNKLGFSVKRTMDIAQKLYEGLPLQTSLLDSSQPVALITYMRTDSMRIADSAIKSARSFIKNDFGDKYLPKTYNVYAKKTASQDAHEAIRPIDVSITPDKANRYLPKDAAKLYSLIWKRFIACQMTPAEYQQRQLSIDGGKYLFRAIGSTLMFDGFLKVYLVEDDQEAGFQKTIKIPKEIVKGIDLKLKQLDAKQHFTQPPPRFTEGSLVKELEKQGIGRPSTYATILSTIQKRDYTELEKKKFIPTELGKSVSNMLAKNLPDIINLKFTATMEEDLDKIASGKAKRDDVLIKFYKKFKKDLEKFAGETKKEATPANIKCPKCKNELVIRFGKAGPFVGCSKFPECNFTSNFSRNEDGTIKLEKPKAAMESDKKCPKCDKNLVEKMGKYGEFLACPGFPDCKYIHQEKLDMKCPQDEGTLYERKSARGSFWGCENFPQCRFAIYGDVVKEPCPKCNAVYLVATKTKDGVVTKCNNKECDFTS